MNSTPSAIRKLTPFIFFLALVGLPRQTTAQQGDSEPHYIGEKFGGGIVFLVYEKGQHGLIASMKDLGIFAFFPSCEGYTPNERAQLLNKLGSMPGLTFSSEYEGKKNTANLITRYGGLPSNSPFAALACSKYDAGGYKDWYLPSAYELKALFDNLFIINTILEQDNDPETVKLYEQGDYWCSTLYGDYPITFRQNEGKLNI
ncbi:MAG: hypothetical protein ABUL44_02285, partial [Flavobacterium sp.]